MQAESQGSADILRWEDLPHRQWNAEILQKVKFRPAQASGTDIALQRLAGKLKDHPELDSDFVECLLSTIVLELRVCRDVYRERLETSDPVSKTERHGLIVELAVAPRASRLLRRALVEYFHCSGAPFGMIQMLFDWGWPARKNLLRGPEIKPAKGWEELSASLIHEEIFRNMRKDEFAGGVPFDPHRMRRLVVFPDGAQLFQTAMKEYQLSSRWIANASTLWNQVRLEVRRMHEEVELEERSIRPHVQGADPQQPEPQIGRRAREGHYQRQDHTKLRALSKLADPANSPTMTPREVMAALEWKKSKVYGCQDLKRTPGRPVRFLTKSVLPFHKESAD